jgi:hypothetical protein
MLEFSMLCAAVVVALVLIASAFIDPNPADSDAEREDGD